MISINLKKKDIPNFEDRYEIWSDGTVWNKKYNRKVNGKLTKSGYKQVHLIKEKQSYYFYIHRLVAEAFIDNPNLYPIVNHRDENKLNNSIENLEWCDISYNNNYGTRNKRCQIHQKNKKQVIMCDLQTKKELQEFISLREAERQTRH